MGDFNFPHINWDSLCVFDGASSITQLFLDAVQDAFLTQHVFQPTRHRIGQVSSILYLIFTHGPYSVNNVIHLAPLGHSDHESLQSTFVCYALYKQHKKFNFFKGDYISVYEFLS